MLTLAEQLGAGLDAHLGTVRDQLGELIVGQPVEEAERGKLVDEHQIASIVEMTGLLMTQPPGRPHRRQTEVTGTEDALAAEYIHVRHDLDRLPMAPDSCGRRGRR